MFIIVTCYLVYFVCFKRLSLTKKILKGEIQLKTYFNNPYLNIAAQYFTISDSSSPAAEENILNKENRKTKVNIQ